MTAACILLVVALTAYVRVTGETIVIKDLSDIFFRLYSRDTIEYYVDASLFEVRNLVPRMDVNKPTVVYIHGYTGSIKSKDVTSVISAYLRRGDHNVIAVDWSRIAGKNYLNVARSAKSVGNAIAGAIEEVVDGGIPKESIHLVGHSMGAQVAGYAARQTTFELKRVTGLDPAGPLFNFLEAHLSEKDASFVDTIHTDSGFYGISRACGTASFYPNAGKRVQPGCPTSYELSSPEEYCSHHRSWLFYSESLTNENAFIGTNCTSYNGFFNGNCDKNTKVAMGYATPTNAKGIFYLNTGRESPFGMQMDGALSMISRRDSNNNLHYRRKNVNYPPIAGRNKFLTIFYGLWRCQSP